MSTTTIPTTNPLTTLDFVAASVRASYACKLSATDAEWESRRFAEFQRVSGKGHEVANAYAYTCAFALARGIDPNSEAFHMMWNDVLDMSTEAIHLAKLIESLATGVVCGTAIGLGPDYRKSAQAFAYVSKTTWLRLTAKVNPTVVILALAILATTVVVVDTVAQARGKKLPKLVRPQWTKKFHYNGETLASAVRKHLIREYSNGEFVDGSCPR